MPESLKLHDAEWLYSVLRRGSRSMRLALLAALPESGFNAPAKVLLESAQPLQTVLAFTQVAGGLCAGVNPALGAQLALATHRYAVELFEASADHAGLVPTTLGLLATQYATASNLLGRSQTTLSFTTLKPRRLVLVPEVSISTTGKDLCAETSSVPKKNTSTRKKIF